MNRVFITPTWSGPDKAEGGIRRVVEALALGLPAYGWEVVDSPANADLINSHGTELVTGYERVPVVQSNHGLMWSEYFGAEWEAVNRQCVRAMQRADAVTFPSRWVQRAVARGLALDSRVIHHGVDASQWKPARKPGAYALWNKARSDAVSDHREVEKLAALMPDVKFTSTIGAPKPNLTICGVVPFGEMKPLIEHAGVYLALPRETFGIGTLEAMASGVPIAGWDYGGQAEIVRQGITGHLAPYGDWDALAECVRQCLANRKALGKAAREDAVARWGWEPRIQQYAELFDEVLFNQIADGPRTSVIVTAFNMEKFLDEALQSVAAQADADWECVVLDDCSADGTEAIARAWETRDARFRYLRPPRNLGLPAARNYAINRARGRYVLPLDADDRLMPGAIKLLADGMDGDRSIQIGYGGLDVMSWDGANQQPSGWRPAEYQWSEQLQHRNQLHYGAIMRRGVFKRTAGYRHRSWQAEDAEFWCYATSFGLTAARITTDSTHVYRVRSDSKTAQNKPMGSAWSDGDWAAWYPYRRSPQATPFGAQGQPAKGWWRVSHGQAPAVSVIVPVGPGHEAVLQDALDSLLAQTAPEWEVIVVNDTGRESLDRRGYEFAEFINTAGAHGAGAARNLGARHARAPLLVFLDADDFLQPTFLQETLKVYADHPGQIIYTDWYQENGTGNSKVWAANDFSCAEILRQMIYNVTVLHPRAAHAEAGGFDETMSGWEDWDYFIKLARAGVCAVHIASPLMTYRYHTGARREQAYAEKERLLEIVRSRYAEEISGRKPMACGSCGGQRIASPPPINVKLAPPTEDMVLMEYTGLAENTHRIVGKVTGVAYRFGNTADHRIKYVYKADVPGLEALRHYRRSAPALPRAEELSPLIVRDRPAPQRVRADESVAA